MKYKNKRNLRLNSVSIMNTKEGPFKQKRPDFLSIMGLYQLKSNDFHTNTNNEELEDNRRYNNSKNYKKFN